MYRELKFKAWNGITMSPVFSLANATKYIVDAKAVVQYTGCNDKHGTEIYEGDIIRRWNSSIAAVVYDGCAFETQPHDRDMRRNPVVRLDFDAAEPLEIIGNIYQNPDLLK